MHMALKLTVLSAADKKQSQRKTEYIRNYCELAEILFFKSFENQGVCFFFCKDRALKKVTSISIYRKNCRLNILKSLLPGKGWEIIWFFTTMWGICDLIWTASRDSWAKISLHRRTFCAVSNFVCQCAEPEKYISMFAGGKSKEKPPFFQMPNIMQ